MRRRVFERPVKLPVCLCPSPSSSLLLPRELSEAGRSSSGEQGRRPAATTIGIGASGSEELAGDGARPVRRRSTVMQCVRGARQPRRTCVVAQSLRWRDVARRREDRALGHAGSAALIASERDHGAGWWRAERGRTSCADGLTASGACMGAPDVEGASGPRECVHVCAQVQQGACPCGCASCAWD